MSGSLLYLCAGDKQVCNLLNVGHYFWAWDLQWQTKQGICISVLLGALELDVINICSKLHCPALQSYWGLYCYRESGDWYWSADLFAALSGGERFTKLCRPVRGVFSAESGGRVQEVWDNQHTQGFNRLPFGCITGKDEAEHLQILAQVLQCLEEYGVRLKQSKCRFLRSQLTIWPACDVWQITQAPTPTNVSTEVISGGVELLLEIPAESCNPSSTTEQAFASKVQVEVVWAV